MRPKEVHVKKKILHGFHREQLKQYIRGAVKASRTTYFSLQVVAKKPAFTCSRHTRTTMAALCETEKQSKGKAHLCMYTALSLCKYRCRDIQLQSKDMNNVGSYCCGIIIKAGPLH